MTLNQAREMAGVGIPELSEYLGISYVDVAMILKNQKECSKDIAEKIKFFLVENYTKCIEDIINCDIVKGNA